MVLATRFSKSLAVTLGYVILQNPKKHSGTLDEVVQASASLHLIKSGRNCAKFCQHLAVNDWTSRKLGKIYYMQYIYSIYMYIFLYTCGISWKMILLVVKISVDTAENGPDLENVLEISQKTFYRFRKKR